MAMFGVSRLSLKFVSNILTFFMNIDRCGLSFLAIQEPGISKYCSVCRKEALDEEHVACMRGGKQGRTFDALFETFDICLDCAAKFQASY